MERRLCVQAKRALAIIPIITISKDEDEDEDHCPGKISKIILIIKPTPFENAQRWMGQNTFPILPLNDDNMIGEHCTRRQE